MPEAILIDVVNSSNNVVRVIMSGVEDQMTFCHQRIMKNYEHVPHLYQSLMLNIQATCKAHAGDFHETAEVVNTLSAREGTTLGKLWVSGCNHIQPRI